MKNQLRQGDVLLEETNLESAEADYCLRGSSSLFCVSCKYDK